MQRGKFESGMPPSIELSIETAESAFPLPPLNSHNQRRLGQSPFPDVKTGCSLLWTLREPRSNWAKYTSRNTFIFKVRFVLHRKLIFLD